MLIAKAQSHLSHMKLDLNFFKSNSIACSLHSLLSLIGIFPHYLFVLTNFFAGETSTTFSCWLLPQKAQIVYCSSCAFVKKIELDL